MKNALGVAHSKKSPCFTCEHRDIGCHVACVQYKDWLKSLEPGKRERQKERDASVVLCRKSQRHIWREMKERQ